MRIDKADQTHFPQCGVRYGSVHVPGPSIPPGASTVTNRYPRLVRMHTTPNKFLVSGAGLLPLAP